MRKRTAILVDAGFFLRRYRRLTGDQHPQQVAKDLHRFCLDHLRQQERDDRGTEDLYRIFVYDCAPFQGTVTHPLSGREVDFSETGLAQFRRSFHETLRRLRKVALRMGELNEWHSRWQLKTEPMEELLDDQIEVGDLEEADFRYDIRQSGLDMRMGLDIASMTFKGLVDQMILISGDSDFVPAAKLARREGVDFILDPMWASVGDELAEHVDGIKTVVPLPQNQETLGPEKEAVV